MATLERPSLGLRGLLTPAAVFLVGAAAVFCVLDRLSTNDRNAEQRFIGQRLADLSTASLRANSLVGCLSGMAGEAVENACEKKIFASPESTAAAASYVSAQLSLLADGDKFTVGVDPGLTAAFAGLRRAIELDRYGLAAHVLSTRDGCTVDKCGAFARVQDATTLKSNLKIHAYQTYVDRYASAWNEPERPAAPVAAAPPTGGPPVAATEPSPEGQPPHAPVSGKYDFPSAASIPPVSIMTKEPPLPTPEKPEAKQAAPAEEGDADAARLPLPPKRPRSEASAPPAR